MVGLLRAILVGVRGATILGGIMGVVWVPVKAYVAVLEVWGWYKQAYSAATAEQMEEWLGELVEAMREKGMARGHYALVFKTPHNDIALDIKVFEGLRERCREVERYPRGSMDYAMSLADIRRQMDKTDFNPFWWWMVQRGGVEAWAVMWGWLVVGVPIVWFVCGLVDERLRRKWEKVRDERRRMMEDIDEVRAEVGAEVEEQLLRMTMREGMGIKEAFEKLDWERVKERARRRLG